MQLQKRYFMLQKYYSSHLTVYAIIDITKCLGQFIINSVIQTNSCI